MLSTYSDSAQIEIGSTSRTGRGGILSKIESAVSASKNGVKYAIVANGHTPNILFKILNGESYGTLFTQCQLDEPQQGSRPVGVSPKILQRFYLGADHRRTLLTQIRDTIDHFRIEIQAENQKDLTSFSGDPALYQRLKCDDSNIAAIIRSLNVLIDLPDPLKKVKTLRQLSPGLNLLEVLEPIGKICVIFESRPDVYPLLLAMAIKTNNSCVFKAGQEISHTGTYMATLFNPSSTHLILTNVSI